jgi:hypothetical protein
MASAYAAVDDPDPPQFFDSFFNKKCDDLLYNLFV